MKKQCKPWFFITVTLFSIFNLLCYFSIRAMWSGVILYLGQYAPYLFLLLLAAISLTCVIMTLHKKYLLILAIGVLAAELFFFGADAYIISQTMEAYHYFIREFMYGLLYLFVIGVIYWLIVYLPKTMLVKKKWFPAAVICILFIGGFLWCFDITPNSINSTPVVYAVEDTYQIVFTTRAKGTAWVVIDGKEYNDTYAGYRETESRIHKITVPMEALDTAGEYTVYARSMLLRGPYCSLQGKTLSKTLSWRGVVTEDGLDYYVLSDVHSARTTPVESATYFGESLDFLITCGDNVSWTDRTADLTEFHTLAGKITHGEIPVIYARGNHETKGVKADQLYQYVGCNGQDYYYTFRLNNLWGVVLDLGEDHGDTFVEYYGAAKFDDYRAKQTTFLDEVLANASSEFDAPGVDYRIAVCHIPITIEYNNDHAAFYKEEWIKRLNQMKLTMLYGGHVHELYYIDDAFEDNQTLTLCKEYSGKETGNSTRKMTAAKFPAILVSRKSTGQQLTCKETVFDTHFIGLAVSSDGNQTVMRYTNENHKIINNIISPWFSSITYGDHITVPNVK